jgi:proteasome lid subunit RPN8/RPN11
MRRPPLKGPLTLPRRLAGELLEHARAALPHEACGLVSGSLGSDGGVARAFHPGRNADDSPLRFSIHPEDLVRITFAIDARGEDVVAVFHSHTRSAAVPSATDLRSVTHPAAYSLIASVADVEAPPEEALRAWRITDAEATEVELRLA